MASSGLIKLSNSITEDDLEELANYLPESSVHSTIIVDLNDLSFIEIGPLAFLISRIQQWRSQEIIVEIDTQSASCFSYLQRIDFFNCLGIETPEQFQRHSAAGKFHPAAEISNQSSGLADSLSEKIAEAVIGETCSQDDFTDQPPTEGAFEAIAYSVSELIKNIQQHSKGKGIVISQYYTSKGVAKVAIFDDGIGIKQSFIESGSSYGSNLSNDIDAIQLALQGEVSSKLTASGTSNAVYGGLPDNAGVGLTFLTMLAIRAGGDYTIISGNGLVSSTKSTKINQKTVGTFVHLSFNRVQLESFEILLEEIKREVLHLDEEEQQEDLSSLFE